MKKLTIILMLLLGLLLTSCGTASNPVAEQVNPTRAATTLPPTETPDPFGGQGPWQVELTETVSGSLSSLDDEVVILLPMYPGGIETWQSFIEAAASAGISTLALYPAEEDLALAPGEIMAGIDASLPFLHEHDFSTLYIAGAGDSTISALLAANTYKDDLAGCITLSALWSAEDVTLSEADLQSLEIPQLWLAARHDMINNSEEMASFVDPSVLSLWIYEGSGLRGTYLLEGLDGQDVIDRMLTFIRGENTTD